MAPQVATILTTILILVLFYFEFKTERDAVSPATWVPYAWMALAGSRTLSQWIHLDETVMTPEAVLEGDPLDRAVFLLLIIIGLVILHRRRINFARLLRKNPLVFLYFFFGATSMIWSDFPGVSFKRLVKTSGNVVMALIVITARDPKDNLGAVIRRLAILLMPLSVLFIKYYPEIGRAYHMGKPMFRGVALQKNGLGQLCLIVASYLVWDLLVNRAESVEYRGKRSLSLYVVLIVMTVWLLVAAGSATSWMCLLLAVFFFALGRSPAVRERPARFVAIVLLLVAIGGALEIIFGLSEIVIIDLLGRDPNLTGRTMIWNYLFQMVRHPLIGTGYESFWLGHRLEAVSRVYTVMQAHNGYIETYLNVGVIGLSILVMVMMLGLVKATRGLIIEYEFSFLRLVLIIVVAVYSWTEATLHGVNNLWLLLLVCILDVSDQPIVTKAARARDGRSRLVFG